MLRTVGDSGIVLSDDHSQFFKFLIALRIGSDGKKVRNNSRLRII